ncbi:Hypothetical predicted protein [Cloeon dipterum]|uniref:SCP domain-containing protein n=1 Tax=Cloeon dipterum TaxID=197152 RepID=A0A8S1DD14_9INSE|nr:Hypothetical predicted protein [Cloeon dipterum]
MRFRNSLLLFMGLVGLSWACDDPKYAKYKDKNHVMCEKPPSCPWELRVKELADYDKRGLINILNNLRSIMATGKTPGFPPASNMQQLTWDDELAALARRALKQCDYEKINKYFFDFTVERFNVSQYTDQFSGTYSLQNEKFAKIPDFTRNIYRRAFDNTYAAKHLAKYNPSHNLQKARGFTLLLWARIKYVGCAYQNAKFNNAKEELDRRTLICLFGPAGNVKDEPVYEFGEPNCQRESTKFPGLCVTEEAEQKFTEPGCKNDPEFYKRYGAILCESKEKLYKWLGNELPYEHETCTDRWWHSRETDAKLSFFVSAILLTAIYAYFITRIQIRIFLV